MKNEDEDKRRGDTKTVCEEGETRNRYVCLEAHGKAYAAVAPNVLCQSVRPRTADCKAGLCGKEYEWYDMSWDKLKPHMASQPASQPVSQPGSQPPRQSARSASYLASQLAGGHFESQFSSSLACLILAYVVKDIVSAFANAGRFRLGGPQGPWGVFL